MRNKKFSIVAVMAAYNEESKIKKVVNDIAKYVDRVIVVDDGSVDDTIFQVKNRKAIILSHMINLGQGAALQTGFDYAKTLDPDVVITYDADGQFQARDVIKFIKLVKSKKADVVLGSRFLGKVIDIPRSRYLILRVGIFFTYIFSNISLTDTHNGFRAFSGKALQKIHLRHNRWAHPSEVIYQISKNKFKVVEVPITVIYSKYSWKKGQKNIEALKIPGELILKALLNS